MPNGPGLLNRDLGENYGGPLWEQWKLTIIPAIIVPELAEVLTLDY